jgi:hypothetical protein
MPPKMAAFNVLVQWHGILPNAAGFVPLSMAEFSLYEPSPIGYIRPHGLSHSHTVFCMPYRQREGE